MGQLCTFCKKMNHYSKLCRSKQVHQLKEEDVSQVSSDDSGDSGDESPLWCTRLNQCVAQDEQFYETVEVEETQVEEFQEINTVRVGRVPETKVETELQAVLTMVRIWWPDTKQQVAMESRPDWTFHDEATTPGRLFFKGRCLTVPKVLRPEILGQIHKSHLGMQTKS